MMEIDSICDLYFCEDSIYLWDSTAKKELQRILNVFESYENAQISYYTPSRSQTFEYNCIDWLDPYGSPFCRNSRLFAVFDDFNYELSLDEMCYCLDSYLGLGYDFISNNPIRNERPVNWIVECDNKWFVQYQDRYTTYFHRLKVQYGVIHTIDPGPYPE